MLETEKAWLAGLLDLRGCITVQQGNNINGLVTLKFNKLEMRDHAMKLLRGVGLTCHTPTISGNTHLLHFSAVNGTILLKLVLPYMINDQQKERGKLYAEIFNEASARKIMKNRRIEGHMRWLKLLRDEVEKYPTLRSRRQHEEEDQESRDN